MPLLAHAEVAGPVDAATEALNAANADWRKYSTYLASRPDAAEIEAIALLIRLAEEFETPIHIVHLASAQALPHACRGARARRARSRWKLACNICGSPPRRFPMARREYKCAPPIRDAANREALWKALRIGHDRYGGDRPLPLPAGDEAPRRRPMGPGLGRHREPWAWRCRCCGRR